MTVPHGTKSIDAKKPAEAGWVESVRLRLFLCFSLAEFRVEFSHHIHNAGGGVILA